MKTVKHHFLAESHKGQAKIRPLWFGPVIFPGLFILVFVMFLLLLRENTYKTQTKELAANAELVSESIRLRLDGNRDYLLMIAKERGDGFMDAKLFQERASRYVADHPEMINITWVDASFHIHDVAPLASNRQILGLRLDLPEPKRVSRLAMERRQPVYTRPFEAIQGKPSFEIWVPVFHGDVFLGLFGGIYSYEKMLHSLVSPEVLQKNNVSVVDASGKVLLELPLMGTVDEKLVHQASLTPPESGVVLRFNRYGRETVEWGLLSLEFLCLALVLGMAYAMWALKREIEVRKQAEATLRDQYSTLRGIIDGVYAFIFSVDRQYRYTSFNRGHAATMNALYGAEIELGHSLLDYMTAGENREAARRNLDRALAGEQFVEDICLGEELLRQYLQISHSPVKTEENEVIIGVAVLSQDVTERKRAEIGLTQLAAIVEFSSDAIIGKTTDGIITSWNRGAERIYGYSADEVIGKSITILARPSLHAEINELLYKVGKGDPIVNYESERIRKDGTLIQVALTLSPIKDKSGNITGISTIARDITERKLAETEIRALKDNLEIRVAERTELLAAANKELEAFSYSVSHDLRSPLRAIDGFSHILLDDYVDKLDDEGKRVLNVIQDNTIRMGQLIDDILNFSRTGRLELSFSEISMEKLAREVAEELQPFVEDSKLQLEIAAIPPAIGDRAMMRQVFVNLLSNAIKFSSHKEPAMIKVGGSIKGDETVYFVQDNGAGFDMHYAEKLFGVFQRMHSESEFEGTGIGLAIVKRIITRHGGRVWAEGKVNEGATIYFALPLHALVQAGA